MGGLAGAGARRGGEPRLVRALALALLVGAAAPGPAAEPAEPGPGAEHPPLMLRQGRLLTAGPEESRISDVTAYCGSCHGDAGGGDRSAEARAHPGEAPVSDHPVDVGYPTDDPDYRSADRLPPEVVLLDGRVSCISCHAHADRRHALVLSGEGSELCRACHLM